MEREKRMNSYPKLSYAQKEKHWTDRPLTEVKWNFLRESRAP